MSDRKAIAPRPFFYSEKQPAAFNQIVEELKPDASDSKFLIAFCTVRRELLNPTKVGQIDLLRIQDWLRSGMTAPEDERVIGYNHSARLQILDGIRRWSNDDLRLLNATCLFLTRSLPWHKTTAIGLLEELSNSHDTIVAYEAAVLWLRMLLESPRVESDSQPEILRLGNHEIPVSISSVAPTSAIDFPLESIAANISIEQSVQKSMSRLLEAASKVTAKSTSLNVARIAPVIDSIDSGDFDLARRLIDCSLADNAPQLIAEQRHTAWSHALIEFEKLVDSAVHEVPFSKRQGRKLSVLVSKLDVSPLDRSEWHRAAMSLIKLGRHPKTSYPWHYEVENAISQLFRRDHPSKKSAQTMLELAKFYIELVHNKKQPHEVLHSAKAFDFAGRAYSETLESSPFARDTTLTYLVAARDYSRHTSASIDLFDLTKALDNMTPRGTRQRRETVSILGMSLSSSNSEDLSADPAKGRQLRDYWLENLEYFRIDTISWNGVTDNKTLAWALREAAVATRIHAMSMEMQSRIPELREALKLAEEANSVFPTSRSRLIYSYVLHEIAVLTDDRSEYQRAAGLQSAALGSVLDRFSDRAFAPGDEQDDSDGLLEVAFVPNEETASEDFETYLKFLTWAVSGNIASTLDTLAFHAAEGARLLYQTGNYDACASSVTGILPYLAKSVAIGTMPYSALRSIQGLTAIGAAANAHLGLPLVALGILEYGTTFASRYKDISTSSIIKAIQDSAVVVQQLSHRLHQPLIYLAALPEGGLAIIVREGRVTTVWLDGLKQSQVSTWLDALVPQSASEETTRGPRGTSSPSHQAITSVVAQARTAMIPLSSELQHDDIVHVIPTGLNAGIPWGPIFNRPLTTTPSGALLHGAYAGSKQSASGRAVIANPVPIYHNGKFYADLPSAVIEADDLHRDFDFDAPLTGANATKKAFVHAMNQGLEVLHIATHAEVDQHSWGEKADILWANNPHTGKAETTPAQEPPPTLRPPKMVFLAACSGAAPDRVLPDEAMSFPTALLAAGVDTVIAPLWPISDRAATDCVNLFYEYLQSGMTPSRALHLAAETDDPSELPTFAAFIIAGNDTQSS